MLIIGSTGTNPNTAAGGFCFEYFAVRNAPIRNKENGNPKQGTHQSETRNAPVRARNALTDKAISCS